MDDLQFLYSLITLRSMHVSYSYKVSTDTLTQLETEIKNRLRKELITPLFFSSSNLCSLMLHTPDKIRKALNIIDLYRQVKNIENRKLGFEVRD